MYVWNLILVNNKSTKWPVNPVFRKLSTLAILPGADPGFPLGGSANPPGAPMKGKISKNFQKTT